MDSDENQICFQFRFFYYFPLKLILFVAIPLKLSTDPKHKTNSDSFSGPTIQKKNQNIPNFLNMLQRSQTAIIFYAYIPKVSQWYFKAIREGFFLMEVVWDTSNFFL